MQAFWRILIDHIELFFFAALPVVELRGAIPLGLALGFSLQTSFLISYLGSTLPCVLILSLFSLIMHWMAQRSPFDRLANGINSRLVKNHSGIERYGYIGLAVFVAIPLPGTGVWTGSGIAAMLKLSRWKAFIAIALGNLVAGLIVTALSYPLWAP